MKNVLNSIFLGLLVFVVSFTVTSCDTVMPEHDETAPEIKFALRNYDHPDSVYYFGNDTFLVVTPDADFQLQAIAYDAEGIKSVTLINTTFARCLDANEVINFETKTLELSNKQQQAQPGDTVKTLIYVEMIVKGSDFYNFQCENGFRLNEEAYCEGFVKDAKISDVGVGSYINVFTSNQVGLTHSAKIELKFEQPVLLP
jgi:hypothetical protein